MSGPCRRRQEGQATVELALVLPAVVLLLLVVVQVGLLARDRVVTVHAARAAARAVAVEPTAGAAAGAASAVLGTRALVRVDGDLRPGGLAGVTVVARPVLVPLVGAAVAGVRFRERLVVRVEG